MHTGMPERKVEEREVRMCEVRGRSRYERQAFEYAQQKEGRKLCVCGSCVQDGGVGRTQTIVCEECEGCGQEKGAPCLWY